MRMILESQLPEKIRNPTNDKEKGWNLCLSEIERIMRKESIYEMIIRGVKNERE